METNGEVGVLLKFTTLYGFHIAHTPHNIDPSRRKLINMELKFQESARELNGKKSHRVYKQKKAHHRNL